MAKKKTRLAFVVFISLFFLLPALDAAMIIKLKFPETAKGKPLFELLKGRHSCRSFRKDSLGLDDLSLLLWAAYGRKADAISHATATVPSAGATYPLELYIVVGKRSVEKIEEGVYHYLTEEHSLEKISSEDLRSNLSTACLGQSFIASAPVSLVIAAKFSRTTGRYGSRGERYVFMESGHVSQNIYLAATNLGLGTVDVGAFTDTEVKRILGLGKDTEPLIIMPIGYPE